MSDELTQPSEIKVVLLLPVADCHILKMSHDKQSPNTINH